MLAALWSVWLIINVAAFALYGVDKRRATRGDWRIPERTLLLSAWLMGGVGAALGMRVFRHKTKHWRFRIQAPLAALVSLGLMTFATMKLLGY